MTVLGYFPGCSVEYSSREYDRSSRWLCQRLGIELQELPDWSCCGAHAAEHTHHILSTALSARNLSIAVNHGLDKVVSTCPACYNRLKTAQTDLLRNLPLKNQLTTELDLIFNDHLEVFSMLEVLSKVEPSRIKSMVLVDLGGLSVVAYYGCLLVRPPELTQFDDSENPVSMDNLLSWSGVRVLPWDYKVQCCGASLGVSDPEIQVNLSGNILEMAQEAGAQAVAVACPLCHINLDLRQRQINKRRKSSFNMPVFYFTQLMGLAFGASFKELLLERHVVNATALLAKVSVK